MDTDYLRKLASESNDGVLRGPTLSAADEIDRLRSEIEGLTKTVENCRHDFRITLKRAEEAEAKHSEAREQVVISQMEMRDRAAKLCAWHSETLVAAIRGLPLWINTQVTLEVYGREKVREGMQRAADIAEQSWEAGYRYQTKERILAAMETDYDHT